MKKVQGSRCKVQGKKVDGRKPFAGDCLNDACDMRYKLTPGTQVREEDFGLLFYTMEGPRLYFIASGTILSSDFFKGDMTLEEWVGRESGRDKASPSRVSTLGEALKRLKEKGVLREF